MNKWPLTLRSFRWGFGHWTGFRFLCFSPGPVIVKTMLLVDTLVDIFIFSNTTRCWTRPSKNNSRANYILSKYTVTLKALRLLSQSFTTTPLLFDNSVRTKPAPLTQRDLHLQAPSWNSFPILLSSREQFEFNAVNYFYVSWLTQ